MPIATPEVYGEMIDRAKEQGFAYPAINVTSSQTLNAALQGFTEAGSDGIVQISTGGAEYASGQTVKDMVTGAVALAEYAHVVAKNYPINVALHTDHCQKEKLDKYVNPLIAISQERVDKGQDPLFNSHMWDGSAIEVEENLQIAEELLSRTAKAKLILEIEVGVAPVGEGGYEAPLERKAYSVVVDFMTPETEGSHWYFWGMARRFAIDDAELTTTIRDGQGKIFAEDMEMLERQQKNLDLYPERRLLLLNIDAGGVRSRRLIEQAIAAEAG